MAKDEPHPGRSIEVDEDVLQTSMEQNPIVTVQKLAERFEFGLSTIY